MAENGIFIRRLSEEKSLRLLRLFGRYFLNLRHPNILLRERSFSAAYLTIKNIFRNGNLSVLLTEKNLSALYQWGVRRT